MMVGTTALTTSSCRSVAADRTLLVTDRPRSGRQTGHHVPVRGPANDGEHDELRLQRGAGRAPQIGQALPRGQVARDRGPPADGDDRGLRPRRVGPDGRAARPAVPDHPRAVRRVGVLLRRAHRGARGDGGGPAVRPLLLHGGPGRQRHPDVGRPERPGVPAPRHRRRRDHRHAGLHRGLGPLGRRRRDPGRHPDRGRLGPERAQVVRDRRPRGRPDPGGGPDLRRAVALRREGRGRRA